MMPPTAPLATRLLVSDPQDVALLLKRHVYETGSAAVATFQKTCCTVALPLLFLPVWISGTAGKRSFCQPAGVQMTSEVPNPSTTIWAIKRCPTAAVVGFAMVISGVSG